MRLPPRSRTSTCTAPASPEMSILEWDGVMADVRRQRGGRRAAGREAGWSAITSAILRYFSSSPPAVLCRASTGGLATRRCPQAAWSDTGLTPSTSRRSAWLLEGADRPTRRQQPGHGGLLSVPLDRLAWTWTPARRGRMHDAGVPTRQPGMPALDVSYASH